MDEPLSNLDAKLRVAMRAEIKELHQRLGITFIYVTHDQTEAMTMSDRVAVILDGELIQVAPPREIYADPADRRVAEFIGSPKINMLQGVVRADGGVDVAGATIGACTRLAAGEAVLLGVRPEAFHSVLRPTESTFTGKVRLIEHLGSDLFVHLDLPGESEPMITRFSAANDSVARGQTIHVGINPGQFLLFTRDGTRLRPRDSRQAIPRSLVQ
jgi:multiple sugar transport system ATP-binding protein